VNIRRNGKEKNQNEKEGKERKCSWIFRCNYMESYRSREFKGNSGGLEIGIEE